METQQLLDAITDHLAIYHRSLSFTKACSKTRKKVVDWMVGLSLDQRQAALTVLDGPWVTLVVLMQKHLRLEGPGSFIVLPDVPCSEPGSSAIGSQVSKKGKTSNPSSDLKGSKPSRLTTGSEVAESSNGGSKHDGKLSSRCSLAIPSLCFRRAKGLVRRVYRQRTAGNMLMDSVRLFSSVDGENVTSKASPEFRNPGDLDCITVAEEFVEDLDKFLAVMDDLSNQEFLESSFLSNASPWEEMPWLKAMGYYSLPAFIANRLEFGLWSAWNNAQGSKRPSRSLALKPKGSLHTLGNGCHCSCGLHGSAAVASSLFGRKQGCMKWWRRLSSDEKENILKRTLALASKSEVLRMVAEVRVAEDLKSRGKSKPALKGSQMSRETLLKQTCTESLSDSEVEKYSTVSVKGKKALIAAPYLVGLHALKHLSLSGLLGLTPALVQKDGGSCLFDSSLKAADTLGDHVLRKVRNILVKVRNDNVERELLGDENSCDQSNSGKTNGARKKKDKNPRRKRSSSLKEEGKINSVESKSPKGQGSVPKERIDGKAESDMHSCDVNGQANGSSTGFESVSKVPKIQGGRRHKSCKSKSKKDDQLHQNSTVVVAETCLKSTSNNRQEEGSFDTECSESVENGQWKALDNEEKDASSSESSAVKEGSSSSIILKHDEHIGTQMAVVVPDEGANSKITSNSISFSFPSGVSDVSPICNGDPSFTDQHCGEYQTSKLCFGTVEVAIPDLWKLKRSVSAVGSASSILKLPSKESCVEKNQEDVGEQSLQDVGRVQGHNPRTDGIQHDSEGSSSLRKPMKFWAIESGLSVQSQKRFEQVQNLRNSHSQHLGTPRASPHEWPGSLQVGVRSAYVLPAAADWLHLDVGLGHPHRAHSPMVAYRSHSVSSQQSHNEIVPKDIVHTQASSTESLDWPPLLRHGFDISVPYQAYTLSSKEEARVIAQSFYPAFLGEMDSKGHRKVLDDIETEDKATDDTDIDEAGNYRGEFDEFDGYMISEEEGERHIDDSTERSSADYHQIFGGGVMYWNSADYTGLGYSRPGSLSSEDSSWARNEADLSVVLDDIVGYQAHPVPYSSKGSVMSSSPPSSSSLPLAFEHLSSSTSNSRICLPRPAANDFTGKFSPLSTSGCTQDDHKPTTGVAGAMVVMEQVSNDRLTQPLLRPIVVMRDASLHGQVLAGEALRLQEARSPHIIPRGRRDVCGHRKRPPSPVLRCLPPAPPPPPPSPVAGPGRRRKGLMAARSGSSSPRQWGIVNWPYKDESDSAEGKSGSPESILAGGRRRASVTATPPMHPLSGALLRERLVAIPPLALEQEHPDITFPMQTTRLHNSDPALHPTLTKLLNALHVEIEGFCMQVADENHMRKPFINIAVKKVAHSLQVLWPRSRTKIFGSIATGLALPSSDVDLVVCLPPVRNLEPIKEAGILEGRNGIKETCLQHAARYLADQDWVKNDSLKTIENTAVPIIMLVAELLPHPCGLGHIECSPNAGVHTARGKGGRMDQVFFSSVQSGSEKNDFSSEQEKGLWGSKADRQLVRLDISFETASHSGLRTAELVRELIGQFPALSPLALILKQFLTDRSLDHPYTGGLSSYCLVLLITRFLQHQQHISRPPANQNLARLFMDFLHFFGCVFDPRTMSVRIRSGGMYVSRDRYHSIDPLYIEDPLDPENNVGRNCFRILQCIKAFADAYAVLEKELFQMSNGSVDLMNGGKSFVLLQKILPCVMGK